MAVVFLARDIKHERAVAIKVLRPEIASRVGGERFLKEIKTTAALVHPHIVSLIDSGEIDGIPYYVMPYIEGESLASRLIRERQLSADDALKITGDVAAALDYAHRSGFVHRDIKPANILLHDGEAMVADFGIALAVQAAGGERLTGTGFAVGTPQYMSPEQAAADRELDARSDIYSLGAVLYEMLAGEPPHSGATVHAVLAKVLSERPTRLSVVRDVPEYVEAAVNKALSKEPSDRFGSCSEFVTALATPGSVRGRPWKLKSREIRTVVTFGLGSVAVVAVAALLITSLDRGNSGGPDPITRQITFSGRVQEVSIAPDGEMIAYLENDRHDLVVRDLASDQEIRLVESNTRLGSPRWNSSGTAILVAGEIDGEYGLHLIPRLGGEARLAVGVARGGDIRGERPGGPRGRPEQMSQLVLGGYDFTADGNGYLVTCCGGRVFRGSEGSAIRAVGPDSFVTQGGGFVDVDAELFQIASLTVSPGGDWFAFVAVATDRQVVLGVSAVDGSRMTAVTEIGDIGAVANPGRPMTVRWPAPGDAIFFNRQLGHGTNIMTVPFDTRRGVVTEEPRSARSGLPLGAEFDISFSPSRLVYAGGPRRAQLELTVLNSRGGDPAPAMRITEGTWLHSSPTISPDGESVAYLKGSGVDWDIYRRPIEGGAEERLTRDKAPVGALAWSPDGSSIAYVASANEGIGLNVLDLATGQARQVGPSQRALEVRPQWSPDGATLLYQARSPEGGSRSVGSEVGRRRPRLVAIDLRTGSESDFERPGFFGLIGPVFSPDSRAIAALGAGRAGERGFGMWVIPDGDGSPRRLVEGAAMPLIWTTDDTIYFIRDVFGTATTRRIERVSAVGGEPELHVTLPSSCDLSDMAISLDGSKIVCVAVDVESDVWVVDSFEPGP
jgi:serine/threonine protein kinase